MHACSIIGGSSHYYLTYYYLMERTRCTPIAICSSPMELDGCTIQYGTDPFYNMLSQPIQATLNSPKVLPAMKENTTYYHHVTLVDNSTTVTVKSIHKTETCEESTTEIAVKFHIAFS